MIVAGSTCNQNGLEVIVRGHEANINMSWTQLVLRPEPPFIDDVDEVDEKYEGIHPQDALRRDFLDCVRTRKPPVSLVSHATKVMVIVDLATRSMWDGKAYAFDPVTLSARAI